MKKGLFKEGVTLYQLIIFLFIFSMSVHAEDVFITRTGRYYYPASSPFVRTRATIKVSREDAESRGYKPSKSYLKAKENEDRTPSVYQQQRG